MDCNNVNLNPNFTPLGDNRWASVRSDGGKVLVDVCDGSELKETELVNYRGPEAAQLADQSARNLLKVVKNKDLFEGEFDLNKAKTKVEVDGGWFGIDPVILDLSMEPLSPAERTTALASFFDGLWSSGLMPMATANARKQIAKLKKQVGWRFRDPKLIGYKELAGYYFQTKQYQKAEELLNKIRYYKLSVTTPTPIFYSEAMFMLADIKRIRAMVQSDPALLQEAADILAEGEQKLHALEAGYRARYNFELLKTCAIYQNQFLGSEQTALEAVCQPGKVRQYFYQATFGSNLYTPLFADNFIAIRSYLETTRYQVATGEVKAAEAELDRVFRLLDFINSSGSILDGNPGANWVFFQPFTKDGDRLIDKLFGGKAGLYSFWLRSEISRKSRLGFNAISGNADQFDRKSFHLFRAAALQTQAYIYRRAALFSQDPTLKQQHLESAKNYLTEAFDLLEKIKNDKITTFYSGALFEEKMLYNQVAVELAETYYRLARLSDQAVAIGLRQSGNELLEKVVFQESDLYLYSRISSSHVYLKLHLYEEALDSFKLTLTFSLKSPDFADIQLMAFYGIVQTALSSSRTLVEAAQKLDQAIQSIGGWSKIDGSPELKRLMHFGDSFGALATPTDRLNRAVNLLANTILNADHTDQIRSAYNRLGGN